MDNLRFVFRANASAFGGHIIRPQEILLESPGGSALSVTGGRSVSIIPKTTFDELFSVDEASTVAEGFFADRAQFPDLTHHRVTDDSLVAVTKVHAEVNRMTVGRQPRMRIERLRAELHARSPQGGGEPSIRVGDVAVEGVEIDGHRLIVELDVTPFQQFDTLAKLRVAADDPAFVKASGAALFMSTPRRGMTDPPPAGRLYEASPGTIYSTIVKSMWWDGDPFPGSVIEYNRVVLPEFGRVYFGEL